MVVLAALLATQAGAAEELSSGAVVATLEARSIPHSAASVAIDGVLDDAIWRDALAVPLTVETYPRENQPPAVETVAYLVENGERLLIAFDALDPDPGSIRAYLRDRDTAYNDDFVGVVLDTFNDQRRAFEFFANPLGVQMDLIQDDVNRNESDAWDAIWESAGEIDASGFAVEMSIPFSQLRFPSAEGDQTWGIDVLRFRPREQRVRMSNNPQDRNRSCYLCQFGKFNGFANVEPGKALEVVPTLTATRTDSAPSSSLPLEQGDLEPEAGLGVRWGITPDLTLDMALNPDFSQIEADVAQLEENTQFALLYPESRPFFLESADYYASPLQAVFTRTVADPDVGAKFTGRTGNNTIGVFSTVDAVTNLLFPGELRSQTHSLDQEADGFVGRYTRGFGRGSTIGALVTSREGNDYGNEVAGLDGRYFINDQNQFRFQYLDSRTQYPEEVANQFGQPTGELAGDAWRLDYRYGSRNWFAQYWIQDIDPEFRADSGFITRVGVVQDRFEFNRNWYGGPGSWYTDFRIGAQGTSADGSDGQLLERTVQPFFSFQGPWQSFVRIGAGPRKEYWEGQLYEMNSAFMFSQFRPRSGLSIQLQMNRGDQIDYANSRLADQRRLQPQIDWNATRHLLVRLRYTSDRLSAQNGPTIFDAKLTDLRVTWQFNLRSFVRLTVQDQDIERNVELYDNPLTDPTTSTLATGILYSYKLNPQTVLFAGYSENRVEDDFTRDLTKTGRTFFLKLSYAWTP